MSDPGTNVRTLDAAAQLHSDPTGQPRTSRVYAVLPTWKRSELLAATLDRLRQQSAWPDMLVVINHEADPATRAVLDRFAAANDQIAIQQLESAENLGSAGGWALGMEWVLNQSSDEDWILTLDDDNPPVADNELRGMFRFAERMVRDDGSVAAVGIVGARFDWRSGRLIRLPDDQLQGAVDVDYVGSGHMALYRVAALREIGVFQRDLFFGMTEVERGLRLRASGYRVVACGDLWLQRRQLENRLNVTIRRRLLCQGHWREYYVCRNYIHVMLSHGRRWLAVKRALVSLGKAVCTVPIHPRAGLRGLSHAVRAIHDGFQNRLGRRISPTPAGHSGHLDRPNEPTPSAVGP